MTDLATRLLGEMIASDGLAWMQRCEAMHRLLGHPVGQAAAVAACASLIADPSNQVFIETMVVTRRHLTPGFRTGWCSTSSPSRPTAAVTTAP